MSERICTEEVRSSAVAGWKLSYTLLELDYFLVGHGVRLGNNGDQVHFGMQASHEFDVNLLQPVPALKGVLVSR
jgi:hypothetical protein